MGVTQGNCFKCHLPYLNPATERGKVHSIAIPPSDTKTQHILTNFAIGDSQQNSTSKCTIRSTTKRSHLEKQSLIFIPTSSFTTLFLKKTDCQNPKNCRRLMRLFLTLNKYSFPTQYMYPILSTKIKLAYYTHS